MQASRLKLAVELDGRSSPSHNAEQYRGVGPKGASTKIILP